MRLGVFPLFPLLLLLGLFLSQAVLAQNGLLESLVKTENIIGHLQEFENIANLPGNQGSRAVYLGHRQSGDYIVSRLLAETDLQVTVQTLPLVLTLYVENPQLSLVSPLNNRFAVSFFCLSLSCWVGLGWATHWM